MNQAKSSIPDKVLNSYPDERVDVWEKEIWNLVLKYSDGHVDRMVANAHNGMDAWCMLKDWLEPKLANRTALLMTQFLCMGECSSNKAVPEALEDFKTRSRQYEGAKGKTLDEELKMSKLMGVLPSDLMSKVKSKQKDHDDCDDVMLIILEELQDFNTGRIPTTKTKPSLNNIQHKWEQEEEWLANEQGDEPAGQHKRGRERQRQTGEI
jgi:hypothetical protein